ncbi:MULTISPECIES: hypothetical protein [unclassified Curtobacterium]|uniref:hypothetical protein n=1 Tax=unclassified Curtobacterium TaxID=257496 RepID=UPI0008269289|nr:MULTISPECIES: hypothetical protein [unclassified Curtobacterium]WIA98355.1 hypothetical protein QOL16_08205 [Curtobacterium sp. MCBA15_004]
MVLHRVTTVYPGLDVPVIESCSCPSAVDHVEVYPVWSELVVEPLRRALRRRSTEVSIRFLDQEETGHPWTTEPRLLDDEPR